MCCAFSPVALTTGTSLAYLAELRATADDMSPRAMAALDFSMTLARSWRARSQKSRDQNATSLTGTMTRLRLPSGPST